MTTILNNIEWSITDSELVDFLKIDNINLDKDDFIERLSQISMNWVPYDSQNIFNFGNIVFLYPFQVNIELESIGEPIETVKYPISSLPTALEVIGAINTFYSRNIAREQQAPELFNADGNLVVRNREFLKEFPISALLFHPVDTFGGLQMVRPGVYLVNINSPPRHRLE